MIVHAQAKPRLKREVPTGTYRKIILKPAIDIFLTDVHMIRGDFMNLAGQDWRDGDFIFANSTCYDDTLMMQIASVAGNIFFIAIVRCIAELGHNVKSQFHKCQQHNI